MHVIQKKFIHNGRALKFVYIQTIHQLRGHQSSSDDRPIPPWRRRICGASPPHIKRKLSFESPVSNSKPEN